MGRLILLLAVSLTCLSSANAQSQSTLDLMPRPAEVQPGNGQLSLRPGFSLAIRGARDIQLERATTNFLQNLRRRTGWVVLDTHITDAPTATLVLHAERASKEVQELGEDESYTLNVTASGARMDAPTTLGILRGLATFLQLVKTGGDGFLVPAVTIHDTPRFPWRGLMIDTSRHFIPLEVLKRNLDAMAAVKLNVFHWHLSDDQGFRIESKEFPKLQEMGSDGLYYTQEQVRELIDYARDQGIRVVPEFDMPGHSTAWFVGYPELASAPGPYEIERRFGVFDPAMNPADEHTYKFLDKFIGEMARLFPDKYFHIGGDEVNGKQWDANPKIQEFMRARGLKSNADLQAYFNQHLQEIVSKHGKIMEGWDEILKPELPKDIVIQSWRGQDALAQAAQQGYRGLLSYGYYLDLMWPAWRHYQVDPLVDGTAKLSPEQQKLILGGEACMWEEYADGEILDARIWPRAAAIAERLWSPQDVTDVDSMYERLKTVSRELDDLGLTHRSTYERMLRRIAGGGNARPVRVLAEVVEPVKDYAREDLALTRPSSFDPLNRMVDVARPESETARRFSKMVDALLTGTATAAMKANMRALLAEWRDNDAALEPLASQSFLVKEVVPLSRDLSSVAVAGLEAMDYLEKHENPPTAWVTQQVQLLAQAAKPKAQLLVSVVPAIERMVEATQPKAKTSQREHPAKTSRVAENVKNHRVPVLH